MLPKVKYSKYCNKQSNDLISSIVSWLLNSMDQMYDKTLKKNYSPKSANQEKYPFFYIHKYVEYVCFFHEKCLNAMREEYGKMPLDFETILACLG